MLDVRVCGGGVVLVVCVMLDMCVSCLICVYDGGGLCVVVCVSCLMCVRGGTYTKHEPKHAPNIHIQFPNTFV